MRASAKTILTFSLGETISNKDGIIDTRAVSSVAEQFKRLVSLSEKVQIIAVAGAGGLGRDYIQFARAHLQKKADLNQVAIRASQVNALLLASVLRNSSILTNAEIPETLVDVDSYLSSGFEAIVLGVLQPSLTSDSTAASIAQRNDRSPLVIVSTAGGILEGSEHAHRQKSILPKVDRSYLRWIIRSEPKEHVLDSQICKILLSKKSKGMKVLVTGYSNILEATKELLSTRSKRSISGATRILI